MSTSARESPHAQQAHNVPPPSSAAEQAPPVIPRTSEVPFFSSLHGRERRDLRGIDRRDLQAAIKDGKKEPSWPHPATGEQRWKYTWAGIVYITDESSTREVTSYAEPLEIPRAALTPEHLAEHEAAKEKLAETPSLFTSHTVIVVDQSGSMRTSDVFDFKNRSQAVFGMLAMDLVAKQRLSGEAKDTDVVSLVLIRDSSEVAFELEPMGLVLYNKFVDLHYNGMPGYHGNFLPALTLAESLLNRQCHSECALSLLFLSDGKPSDQTDVYPHWIRCEDLIEQRVASLSGVFGRQLSVSTLGFASRDQDFSVLENMAKAARRAGAGGDFHRPEMSSFGLGTAISHTVSSLTSTKMRLTALAGVTGRPRVLLQVEREALGNCWHHLPARNTSLTEEERGDAGWVVHRVGVQRWKFSINLKKHGERPWVLVPFLSDQTDCIAAGRLWERGPSVWSTACNWSFVGPRLVAKESRDVEDEGAKMAFHETFIMTQLEAQRFAQKFNRAVKERLCILGSERSGAARVWEVTFLDCYVYTYDHEYFGLLAEDLLEPSNRYTKWNGNNGYVYGRDLLAVSGSAPGVHSEQARAQEMMDTIAEGDGEDCGSEDTASSTESTRGEDEARLTALIKLAHRGRRTGGGRGTSGSSGIPNGDVPITFNPTGECYLQAFSHFSYRYSRRRRLVCDLQGVLSSDVGTREGCEGVFKLTDPVIHYSSRSGRRQVYGKTDFGRKGMQNFFKTHLCNDVCVLLGLACKNRC